MLLARFIQSSGARSLSRRSLFGVGRSSVVLYLALLVAAVVLRAYWVVHHSAVLSADGGEYARIAENLLRRGSYTGLFEGPELMFPPFFPVLLALSTFFTGSIDIAARLIPFLAGVLLVPVVFALGRVMYGPRVALGAAALIALHPVLIDLSGSAYSESIYLLLMFAGLYCALRALDSGSLALTVCCGTLFGLAFLTRPEALFYPFVVLVVMLSTDLGTRWARRFAVRSICLFAPIVILTAPYAAYISRETGSLRLEGKSIMNYTIGERRNAGIPPHEAALGIGPNLSEDGPQLSPNHFIAAARRAPSARELASYWVESARRNKKTLPDLLLSPPFGSLLVIGLMVLGLFSRPWHRPRAVQEAVLIGVALGHLLLLLGLHLIRTTYLLPLMAVLLFWVSKGVDEAARWGMGTARRALAAYRPPARWLDASIRCVLIAALVVQALWGMRWGTFDDQGPNTRLLKDVGVWLDHYRPGDKRIMTLHPTVAYYSAGILLLMPVTTASLALQYVHLKRPDFIVLFDRDGAIAAYLRQWLDDGIPDKAASIIYRASSASHDGVTIYEWRGSGPAPSL